MIKCLIKLIAISALAALVLAATAVIYLAVRRNEELTLPTPAGPYSVGRLITLWNDVSRRENLGGTPDQHRKLSVWIWYPADRGGSNVPYTA